MERKVRSSYSAGAIPVSCQSGLWSVFLIAHRGYEAYWGCPKGHVEPGETDQEAARRELKEETNLEISRFLSKTPIIEEFTYLKQGKPTFKRILFFLVEATGIPLLQKEEIAAGKWFPLADAIERVIHPEGKATLRQVQEVLMAMPS